MGRSVLAIALDRLGKINCESLEQSSARMGRPKQYQSVGPLSACWNTAFATFACWDLAS
jgi:hypothetical protein